MKSNTHSEKSEKSFLQESRTQSVFSKSDEERDGDTGRKRKEALFSQIEPQTTWAI